MSEPDCRAPDGPVRYSRLRVAAGARLTARSPQMVLAICAPRLFRGADVAASVQEGADLVTGGKRPASMGKGWYFEPTILACPGPKISSAREELFGPVLSAFRFNNREGRYSASEEASGPARRLFRTSGRSTKSSISGLSPISPIASGDGRICGPIQIGRPFYPRSRFRSRRWKTRS